MDPLSSRLGDDIEQRRLTSLYPIERARNRRGERLWIGNRSFTEHAVRLRHLRVVDVRVAQRRADVRAIAAAVALTRHLLDEHHFLVVRAWRAVDGVPPQNPAAQDRKSTRLNSSHEWISYAVFCLKKKEASSHAPRMKRNPLS